MWLHIYYILLLVVFKLMLVRIIFIHACKSRGWSLHGKYLLKLPQLMRWLLIYCYMCDWLWTVFEYSAAA